MRVKEYSSFSCSAFWDQSSAGVEYDQNVRHVCCTVLAADVGGDGQ